MNEHIVTQISTLRQNSLEKEGWYSKEIKELFNKLTPKPPVEF
jgi:hypothetical protein